MKYNDIGTAYILLALISLFTALLFGVIGSIQYLIPGFFYDILSFEKIRPLHVSLIVTWLFTAAVGGIYYYIKDISRSNYILALGQLILIIITGIAILYSYIAGYFGGREYFEFPPILAIPMGISWILFMIAYFRTIEINIKEWKIYHWMWSTGIVFFMLTFIESYLWTMDFFNKNLIRDITVQWKAMGAFVGSWNMLIYGTAFYLMEKIGRDSDVVTSKKTYFFYFLGLTNLMFNWGHHTYNVPAASWIRTTAYLISMTELLILGNIILSWRSSVKSAITNRSIMPYRFLFASDIWIFLNLTLAIAISIPAINIYTHGTHITVAHAMGATIGINTMILFSSLLYIGINHNSTSAERYKKQFDKGLIVMNISLLVFWVALIGAGISKAINIAQNKDFYTVSQDLQPFYVAFAAGGAGIFSGLLLLIIPLLQIFSPFNFSTYQTLIKKQV